MDQNLDAKAEASETPGAGRSRLGGKDTAQRIALAVLVALLFAGLTIHLRWLLSQPNLSEAVKQAGSWVHMLSSGARS